METVAVPSSLSQVQATTHAEGAWLAAQAIHVIFLLSVVICKFLALRVVMVATCKLLAVRVGQVMEETPRCQLALAPNPVN